MKQLATLGTAVVTTTAVVGATIPAQALEGDETLPAAEADTDTRPILDGDVSIQELDAFLDAHGLGRGSNGTDVRLPWTGRSPIQLNTTGGAQVYLRLPEGIEDRRSAMSPSTAGFESRDETFEVFAQEMGSDARALVVIETPDAPTEYRFDVFTPGGQLVQTPDGGVEVRDSLGEAVAFVAPPWAKDANGDPVPTRYTLDGNTIVQEVDHYGAAYPVVADPAVQADCGWVTCTVRFDRATTRWIKDHGTTAGAIVSSVCALLVVPLAQAACLALVNAAAGVVRANAADYYSNGNCYGMKYPRVGGPAWSHQVAQGTYNCAGK